MSQACRSFLFSAALLSMGATMALAVEITPAASGVTASTSDTNVPGNTVDNNLGTRWSGNGDGAWIRFDLGSVQTVEYVRIAVYGGNARQNRFDLDLSTDGATWTRVITNKSTSGTTTAEETHDFTDTPARYVRYVGHGSTAGTWNSLSEVSIFGGTVTATPTPVATATPSPVATATPVPVATPTPTSTPTTYTQITPGASAVTASTNDGNVPANVVDKSLSTRWSANGDGQWLRMDLGTTHTIGYVKVATYQGNARSGKFDIQTSSDNSTWTTVFSGQSSGTSTALQTFDFGDTSARYVRYLGHMNTVNGFNSVTEIEIWGMACTTCPTPTPTARPTATPRPTPTPTGTWNKANLTNFESYPDPNSDECIKYSGCQYEGQFAFVSGTMSKSWVQAHNIIAVHSKDAGYANKTFHLRQGTHAIDATVYDECADSDCSGCCTANARQNGLNFLIDMEKYTVQRFGSGEGIVEWQVCSTCPKM
jgi:poly(beta-D-mannuronate) lyase